MLNSSQTYETYCSQRWAEYLGESRANLVRAGLYVLITLFLMAESGDIGGMFRRESELVYIGFGAALVLGVAFCLRQKFVGRGFKYTTTFLDIAWVTMFVGSYQSAVLALLLYPIVVGMALMRRSMPLFVVALLGSVACSLLTESYINLPEVVAGTIAAVAIVTFAIAGLFASFVAPPSRPKLHVENSTMQRTEDQRSYCACGATLQTASRTCWLCRNLNDGTKRQAIWPEKITYADQISHRISKDAMISVSLAGVLCAACAPLTSGVSLVGFLVMAAATIPRNEELGFGGRIVNNLIYGILIVVTFFLALLILLALYCMVMDSNF